MGGKLGEDNIPYIFINALNLDAIFKKNISYRYFLIKFGNLKNSRILDVGVTASSEIWDTDDFLLLGALNIQKGF